MITAAILLCVCVAGFIHGFTGFGYAMIAMATLPWLMSMEDALFLAALFTLPVAAANFWRHRQCIDWAEARTLLAGSAAGTPLGLVLVEVIDQVLLLRLLGVILIVFPLNELVFSRWWTIQMPAWLGFPIGVLSGILGGAFSIGGPPAIIYVCSRRWRWEQSVATLQVLFCMNSGLRVLVAIPTGILTQQLAVVCALALGPFVFAALAGGALAAKSSPHRVKQVVLVALIVMGMRFLAQMTIPLIGNAVRTRQFA